MLLKTIVLVVAVLLSGCSINSLSPVEGWPQLDVREHYVPIAKVRDECSKYAPWWSFGLMEACAVFDLWRGTCNIWFSNDPMPPEYMIAHERQHCKGYDHFGSNSMAAYLKTWRVR